MPIAFNAYTFNAYSYCFEGYMQQCSIRLANLPIQHSTINLIKGRKYL